MPRPAVAGMFLVLSSMMRLYSTEHEFAHMVLQKYTSVLVHRVKLLSCFFGGSPHSCRLSSPLESQFCLPTPAPSDAAVSFAWYLIGSDSFASRSLRVPSVVHYSLTSSFGSLSASSRVHVANVRGCDFSSEKLAEVFLPGQFPFIFVLRQGSFSCH